MIVRLGARIWNVQEKEERSIARKRSGKEVSQGEVEAPFSGGYDAQQAKCAPQELDQISGGQISEHKVMSEDAGEVGIARGPSRLKDTDEEGVCDSERSITRLKKEGNGFTRPLSIPPTTKVPYK